MMKSQKENENSIIFRFLVLGTDKKHVYENADKIFQEVGTVIDFLSKTEEKIKPEENGMNKKLK